MTLRDISTWFDKKLQWKRQTRHDARDRFKYPVGDGFAKTGNRLTYPRLRGMWKQQVGHSLFLLPSVKVYRPTKSGCAVRRRSQRRDYHRQRRVQEAHPEVNRP